MSEERKCPVELKPMATWVQEEDPKGICRECLTNFALSPPINTWFCSCIRASS
ncbi:unnamed protein product [marine sediment metagenome]|uniref:Uncharacterized protein n=1 Tax=marine sediment metagenome TaxID=412755 RepID=X1J4M0_9ZZZZ